MIIKRVESHPPCPGHCGKRVLRRKRREELHAHGLSLQTDVQADGQPGSKRHLLHSPLRPLGGADHTPPQYPVPALHLPRSSA